MLTQLAILWNPLYPGLSFNIEKVRVLHLYLIELVMFSHTCDSPHTYPFLSLISICVLQCALLEATDEETVRSAQHRFPLSRISHMRFLTSVLLLLDSFGCNSKFWLSSTKHFLDFILAAVETS